jgi:hypothetical protein
MDAMRCRRDRRVTAIFGRRAIAILDREAAIRPPALEPRKKLKGDVDFRKPRSSFRYQVDEAGSMPVCPGLECLHYARVIARHVVAKNNAAK